MWGTPPEASLGKEAVRGSDLSCCDYTARAPGHIQRPCHAGHMGQQADPAANTAAQLQVLLGPQALGHQRNREPSSGVLESSLPVEDALPGLSCWKCPAHEEDMCRTP